MESARWSGCSPTSYDEPFDLVVLDPPREGAKRKVVEQVVDRAPRAVAYVACDPAALARDVAIFAEHGYRLERLRALRPLPDDAPRGVRRPAESVTSLKYAHVERERRWLLRTFPAGFAAETRLDITDRYVDGTRLRLRETVDGDGVRVRKLGQKVRLGDGPGEIACTSVYLDEAEWALLSALPAAVLRKHRSRAVLADGVRVAVDVFAGDCTGLVLLEVDRGDGPDRGLPAGFEAVAEVTHDEGYTGGALARHGLPRG